MSIDFKIDPELKALLDPLAEEERRNLEKSIISEGCMSPLVVWKEKNTLLDGHHRYEICTRNKIKFEVKYRSFLLKVEAMAWMLTNQIERRNLSPYARAKAVLRLEAQFKLEAKERQLTKLKQFSKSNTVQQNSGEREEAGETRKKLAELANISHDTLSKVKRIEEKATLQQKAALASGKHSINSLYNEIEGNSTGETSKFFQSKSFEWYSRKSTLKRQEMFLEAQ